MEVTAVEWFAQITKELGYVSEHQLEQAKQMEKQQIIDAWQQGHSEGLLDTHTIAEDYYNDHYGKAN